MPNESPLSASDMPTVLPGQVSPGQPARRSPLSQEPRKALEVLRYNLPFVGIMPLALPTKFYYLEAADQFVNIDFPDGALAVNFSSPVRDSIFMSVNGNPANLTTLTAAAANAVLDGTMMLPVDQWLYCENIKNVTVANFGEPAAIITARFYIQL